MSGASKQRWSEMSPGRRATIVALWIVQASLLGAALLDLRRRPASEINGDKRIWVGVSFVNYLGPLAYFRFGRKR